MIGSVKVNGTEFTKAARSLDPAEITVPAVSVDTKIEVRFAEKPSYTVTVYTEGNGRVIYGTEEITSERSKAITVKYGDSITLTAEADDEYNALYGWKKNGAEGYISTGSSYTLSPDSDMSITAVFGKAGAYDVSYDKLDFDNDGGIIASMTVGDEAHTGEAGADGKVEKGNISEGTKVVFKAEPAPRKCVGNWIIKRSRTIRTAERHV